MGRARKGGALSLWMNGLRVGTWTVSARGEHELRYDPGWVSSERGRPLSLSMPLRPANEPYRGPVVRNFFENLLPDNTAIRERMQARFRTSSARAFELLAEVGRDCVGALQLLPEDGEPGELRRIEGAPLSDPDVARILRNLTLAGRHQDDEAFRISIAGAQEKTALLWHRDHWLLPTGPTPTSHILKLPLGSAPGGVDLSTSVENEWLCGQLLARYGVPMAETRMAQFDEQRVLVVTRFDRQFSSDGS